MTVRIIHSRVQFNIAPTEFKNGHAYMDVDENIFIGFDDYSHAVPSTNIRALSMCGHYVVYADSTRRFKEVDLEIKVG